MAAFGKLCFISVVASSLAVNLRNSTATSVFSSSADFAKKAAPCQCLPNDPTWKQTTRTVPKCVFIDLGAAHGNSFDQFLKNAYGPVAKCPSGQWEAILVEANPQFTAQLNTVAAAQPPGAVRAMSATAAYQCAGTTSFSIDPDVAHNRWGSSMKFDHKGNKVTVPTINVNQLVAENVMPGDWVMLKIDIEGAEYDVLPCLSQFTQLNKIDIIYVEEHAWMAKNSEYTPQQYAAAKASLVSAGISMPYYDAPTL